MWEVLDGLRIEQDVFVANLDLSLIVKITVRAPAKLSEEIVLSENLIEQGSQAPGFNIVDRTKYDSIFAQ
jgi:hypothetical protein